MMDGSCSKVTISDSVILELESICHNARLFVDLSYVSFYKKTVKSRFLLLFNRNVVEIDYTAAYLAASKHHCNVGYSYGYSRHFEVNSYIADYEQIIALSKVGETYLGPHLSMALSVYMDGKNEV